MRSRDLLMEEYPLAKGHIRPDGDSWLYEANVRQLDGIGRFVMGLIEEVAILEGDPLLEYVREKCRRGLDRI